MIEQEVQHFAQDDLVLGYSATERAAIAKSIDALMSCINSKLNIPLKNMCVFGSYTRNTILPRRYDESSDVDILVVMGTYSYLSNSAIEAYRDQLRDALERSYPMSDVRRDFPCVKLELGHIKFDLVPSLVEYGFYGSGVTYRIPSRFGAWQVTEPNDINEPLMTSNQLIGGNRLRQVIRLCKHWNAAREDKQIESYLLEKAIINQCWSLGLNPSYNGLLDGFLNAVHFLAPQVSDCTATLSCIEKVQRYQSIGDEEGMRTWLKHLLPEFA